MFAINFLLRDREEQVERARAIKERIVFRKYLRDISNPFDGGGENFRRLYR